jgi:hypothetical protein
LSLEKKCSLTKKSNKNINLKIKKMKKIILLSLLLISISINAQDDEIFGNESSKVTDDQSESSLTFQESGTKTFEVSFDPGNIFGSSQGDVFSLINGGIKYRSFSSDKKAFRLGADLSLASVSIIIQEENEEENLLELKSNATIYRIAFMPGFEKHYTISDKVSPYTGMQFLLAYSQTKLSAEYQDGNDIYTESWINDPEKLGSGSFDIGIGLVTGVDYYFLKNFYAGIEIGYGIEYSKILPIKYVDESDEDNNKETPVGSGIKIAPSMSVGNIRLGWRF